MIETKFISLDYIKSLPVLKLADLYPMMANDDEIELIASVEANGIREALIIYKSDDFEDGQLLDGRNRLAVADKVGLDELPVRYFVGTIEEAEALIIDLNERRRHLRTEQRATIAEEHAAIVAERAKERQRATQLVGRGTQAQDVMVSTGLVHTIEPEETGRTSTIVAKQHGVGRQSVEAVQKIRRVAQETMNDPDQDDQVVMTPRAQRASAVLNKMKNGKITVSDAVKNVFGEPGQEISPDDPKAKFRSQLGSAQNKWQEAARQLLDSERPEDWENVRLKEREIHHEFGSIEPIQGLMDPDESRERFDRIEQVATAHGEKMSGSPKISVSMTKPCGCDYSEMESCDQCKK